MTSEPSPHAWRELARETVAENPWFGVHRSDVELPSGKRLVYNTIHYRKIGVGAVPRRRGEIALIRQYRNTVQSEVWGIPSGSAEPDEDPGAAAAREMLEETGYRAGAVRRLVRYHPSYGVGDEIFDIYEADVTNDAPVAFDADEVIEVRWFSEQQVAAMILGGEMIDGLSLTPLLLLCAREGWAS